ncbi:hypothetical protein CCACVL1_03597 [Corchorus capsularis]|uniref:Uncharacterized protein n=1 Tax=Corchorus capsularis TaxID=210143 RepID=A0A1R3JYM8_COCAP|nr:hypothetical protein CCACVL1_03597 [Corchorus capsularis]
MALILFQWPLLDSQNPPLSHTLGAAVTNESSANVISSLGNYKTMR